MVLSPLDALLALLNFCSNPTKPILIREETETPERFGDALPSVTS